MVPKQTVEIHRRPDGGAYDEFQLSTAFTDVKRHVFG